VSVRGRGKVRERVETKGEERLKVILEKLLLNTGTYPGQERTGEDGLLVRKGM
jgi:hypothetical protein